LTAAVNKIMTCQQLILFLEHNTKQAPLPPKVKPSPIPACHLLAAMELTPRQTRLQKRQLLLIQA
jgi:hypothetical protein